MTKKERTPNDETNKRLFSEPRMIEDLLKGFVTDSWIEDLDFSTLERVNSSFVSSNDEMNKRDGDMIWKIRWKNRWVYLLIVIEFQSRVDQIMAVRMCTYTSLLYEEIFKSDKTLFIEGYLPPVLPMVLYNGGAKWTAARSLRELMAPDLPEGLLKYQPSIHYWLLEEGRAKLDDELARADNFVSLLVQLEQVKEIVPDFKFDDITEVNQMLSETVDMWIQGGFEKGHAQGIAQGIAQGESQGISLGESQGISLGERRVIERQLNKKFGKLTPAQIIKLNTMSEKELLQLSETILFAYSIEEIFGEMTSAIF